MKITFRNHPGIIRLRQLSVLLGTLIFVFTFFLDLTFAVGTPRNAFIARFVSFLPFFCVALVFSSLSRYRTTHTLFIAMIGPIATLSLLVSMVLHGGTVDYIYPIGIVNTLLWTYMCTGIEYPTATVLNHISIILFAIADCFFLHYSLEYRVSVLFFIFCFMVVGYVGARFTQKIISKSVQQEVVISEALETKSRAFVKLAHETRTPLMLIRNYFRRVEERYPDSNDLRIVRTNLERLERDMTNILTLERELKERVEQERRACSLSAYLDRIEPILRDHFRQKDLRLSIEGNRDLMVGMSESDLNHVLLNLLENAYKFSPTGSCVCLIMDQKKRNRIEVIVEDAGPGIAEADREQVVRPYSQVGTRNTADAGIGMGLAIVSQILGNNGGSLEIDGAKGGGARMVCSLPLADSTVSVEPESTDGETLRRFLPPEVREASSGSSHGSDASNMVLIVEDNPDMLRLLAEELSSDFGVVQAVNAEEAIEHLRSDRLPDVIVSDLMLGEGSGLDVLRVAKEREDELNAWIPFVIISAAKSEDYRLKGLRSGAVDFIHKPFDVREIRIKIARWLNIAERTGGYYPQRKILEDLQERYGLSLREFQVLILFIQGESRDSIAQRLFISLNTVKTHIRSIYFKFDVHSRIELKRLVEDSCVRETQRFEAPS